MMRDQPSAPLWDSPQGTELMAGLDAARSVVSRTWSFATRGKIRSLAIWRSGEPDDFVLVGSEDKNAYLLTGDGRLRWQLETDAWVRGLAFAHGNDGELLAVVGAESVRTVDKTSAVRHEFPCDSPVCCLRLVHVDRTVLIITGHDDGTVEARDLRGNLIWTVRCPKRVFAVECCDVNLDGAMEVAAASEDTFVYIISAEGKIVDRFRTSHWIISLAVGDVYADGISRLLIAGFNGEIYVYGGGKTAALRVRRRGIVGLAMGRLIAGSRREQFVVGTADQRVTIFETTGRELWRFSTGFGTRVIQVLQSDTSASLVLGGEDGNVHRMALGLRDGLRDQIVSAARDLGMRDVPGTAVSPSAALILGDLLHLEERASVYGRQQALAYAVGGQVPDATREFLGYWCRGAEELWAFRTGGRVYNVAFAPAGGGDGRVLAASGDGYAYALNLADGARLWRFKADQTVRGAQWVEHDTRFGPGAVVGSEDGCVYRLDEEGMPIWHLQTRHWVLYVAVSAGPWRDDNAAVCWFGSEGGYVAALDRTGRAVWRVAIGDRVRALAVAEAGADGAQEIVAGADDRHVYVIDAQRGRVKRTFVVPHWVLGVAVQDIDDDGRPEILVGTEDGSCYAYDLDGRPRWSFGTDGWVAAIGTCVRPAGAGADIVVGSADSCVYALSGAGERRWRWQTGARVRTVTGCGSAPDGAALLAYGSYDEHVHLIRRGHAREYRDAAADIVGRLRERVPALAALADCDVTLARQTFNASGSVAERALVSSVLLTASRAELGDDLIDAIGRFLVEEATEEECMATAQTAGELSAYGGDAFAAVAEAMARRAAGGPGTLRAAAIRAAGPA